MPVEDGDDDGAADDDGGDDGDDDDGDGDDGDETIKHSREVVRGGA